MLIRQRGVRLQKPRTVLHIATQVQDGLRTDVQFRRQGDRRFTFQNTSQEHHDLRRGEMTLLKDRVAVEIVSRATGAATIDRQLTFLSRAMDIGVGHRVTAVGTHQTLRMKVVQNPLRAFSQAE